MARDDRLKKVQEAGAEFLESARVRAEEFLAELARAGTSSSDKAQETVNEWLEASRKGAENLAGLIRAEISSQLAALGLATKADLKALEARLGSAASKPATSAATKRSPRVAAPRAAKKAPTGAQEAEAPAPKAPARKASARAAASKSSAPRKAPAASKAPAAPVKRPNS